MNLDRKLAAVARQNNGLVGTTDAAKNDRIVEIDGFAWYLASSAPSSWQTMVDDVRTAL